MALDVRTIWECNASATANNVNGGGFNRFNPNMLTDLAGTDANTAAPIVSSAFYNFVAEDVGHWLFIQSGANWTPGWYKIASVSSGDATLDADVGEAVIISGISYVPNTVAGCATTASPTSGTFAVDYSQETGARLNGTTGATGIGSTYFLVFGGSFTTAMVGNMIHITAVTGTGCLVGWYEIVEVLSATTLVLDRTPAPSNDMTVATWYVGGALSLNSALDDDFHELLIGDNAVGAPTVFYKYGTYAYGENIAVASDGATLYPVRHRGYKTVRGDNPTGADRPTIALAARTVTYGDYNDFKNLIYTSTAAAGITTGTGYVARNCKFTNISSTADRVMITAGVTSCFVDCEISSYFGFALAAAANVVRVIGCYIHDCLQGLRSTNAATQFIAINNIFENCVEFCAGAETSTYMGLTNIFEGNTFYGAENKLGDGLELQDAVKVCTVTNNIFYGLAVGLAGTIDQYTIVIDNNDFYNNTADKSSYVTHGANDIFVNPAFTNVGQVTGTAGAFAAGGSKLVDTSKNFTALGVVAGDTVYIKSGTGVTAGIYLIDSISTTTNANDTLNLTIPASPGTDTTADKVYQITIGHNFLPTATGLTGFPGTFQAGKTTGYKDIGAVQKTGGTGSVNDVFGIIG